MDQSTKLSLLKTAQNHVLSVKSAIVVIKKEVELFIQKIVNILPHLDKDEQYIQEKVLFDQKEQLKNMEHLYDSPYFVRCDVLFDGRVDPKILYFSKFPLEKQSIYSWVTPAATLRFNEPGQFMFKLLNGEKRTGRLLRKDQFMIVNGKIVFMSTESVGIGRQLVHQEHFSTQKTDFMLPEIVEQMEKAQDAVIRAAYKGSFLISGPAGSGKTTLALHRVAYLAQSPESMHLFVPENMIVFVHDQLNKQYFSKLLPDLGIHGVTITTFDEWGFARIEEYFHETGFRFQNHHTDVIDVQDGYEYAKNHVLNNMDFTKRGTTFDILESLYTELLQDETFKSLFQTQKTQKILDRFDITILLLYIQNQRNGFFVKKAYWKQLKNGRYQKKHDEVPLQYSLMIIDEVQNYLPQQIQILQSRIHEDTKALLYVGDLAQQTFLRTLSDWEQIGERFAQGRKVILQKVYRNTKHILQYIRSLGYEISIPDSLREGDPVEERVCATPQEEIMGIEQIIAQYPDMYIGILHKQETYLTLFKERFAHHTNVRMFSLHQAQGVEFDIVIMVGVHDMFVHDATEERKRVDRDLLYMGLTRAMKRLYVFGKDKLSAMQ